MLTIIEFQIKKEGAKNQYLWFEVLEDFTIGQLIALKDRVLAKTDKESKVFISFCFNATREDFPAEITTSWEKYLNVT